MTVERDALGHDTKIAYDDYRLLPTAVEDAAGLVTKADYDYRVLKPGLITDPNGNRTLFAFTPLGLLRPLHGHVGGKDAEAEATTPEMAERTRLDL